MSRFFKIEHVENWITIEESFIEAENHKKASEMLPEKSKRVLNDRYNEIEKTGKYYRITENLLYNGKAFIFEIL